MDYSNLNQQLKDYYIHEYSKNALELREKASNPRARKAAEFNNAAEELENIVIQLKAA